MKDTPLRLLANQCTRREKTNQITSTMIVRFLVLSQWRARWPDESDMRHHPFCVCG